MTTQEENMIDALVKDVDENPCKDRNIYVEAQRIKNECKSQLSLHEVMRMITSRINALPSHSSL